MTFANTFGKAIGNTVAWTEHGVARTFTGSCNFAEDTYNAAVQQYDTKSKELLERRVAIAQGRAQRKLGAPQPA